MCLQNHPNAWAMNLTWAGNFVNPRKIIADSESFRHHVPLSKLDRACIDQTYEFWGCFLQCVSFMMTRVLSQISLDVSLYPFSAWASWFIEKHVMKHSCDKHFDKIFNLYIYIYQLWSITYGLIYSNFWFFLELWRMFYFPKILNNEWCMSHRQTICISFDLKFDEKFIWNKIFSASYDIYRNIICQRCLYEIIWNANCVGVNIEKNFLKNASRNKCILAGFGPYHFM